MQFVFSLNNHGKLKRLICIPGNAGTEKIAENVKANISNFNNLYKIIRNNKIDLVISWSRTTFGRWFS